MLATTFPLTPKNPNGPLKVIIIGRSSTAHQKEDSIHASYRFTQTFLEQVYKGPMEIEYLGEQASCVFAGRPTLLAAEELIATGAWDLVLVEDLSRIHRESCFQWAFVQNVIDNKTRLICIADQIDTSDENWVDGQAAALRHSTRAFSQGG